MHGICSRQKTDVAFPPSALVAASYPLPRGISARLAQGHVSQSRGSPRVLRLGKQTWLMCSLGGTFCTVL